MWESFQYCITKRKDMTIKFITDHYNKVNEDKKKRSIARKAGGWMQTLIVYGVVVAIVGSSFYANYKAIKDPQAAETEMKLKRTRAKTKMTPTGEEYARQAAAREAEEEARRRKFEQEVDKAYNKGSGEDEDDLLERLTKTDDL